MGGHSWGIYLGFSSNYAVSPLPLGVSRFWSESFVWFYLWFFVATTCFALVWKKLSSNQWQRWSIWGTALILFNIWFSVQVSVAINAWYEPFYDLIQKMLSNHGGNIQELYSGVLTFLYIAMVSVTVAVLNSFLVSHYIFRWRTAMNDYYLQHWQNLRHIEGASQRVQEDTMRFATIMEDLGVKFVKAIMVLIAFLPILFNLSKHVPVLPLVGQLNHSLVWAALVWAILGTVLLIVVGMKLPGLAFNNQKVEAALRKELVYGEDNELRAEPVTIKQLFSNVRKNYFKLYFHYVYFNLVATWYMQLDILFSLVVLFPSIAAGTMTLGLINQVGNVFDKVRESFQYLITSWKTIIEILSIRKRLKEFENTIN